MGRAPCCDKSKVKRGPWSPEEDSILKNYVHKHGTAASWIALPHKAGLKRCGKSCRLRWLNYLRPNIKHGGFTDEEDTIILTLFRSIGSRWSVIASQLAGRTDNDVKNYWNTKLKKKLLMEEPLPNLITPTHNNMDLSTNSRLDHEQMLVPIPIPNANAYHESGFLQHTPSSTSSFCAEDEAFLVGWGSAADHEVAMPYPYDQFGHEYDIFNLGYFDPPNIADNLPKSLLINNGSR